MTEPRRLNRSGGISQRLLDSASLDKPSQASRRHAINLAATASAFSNTRSGATIPLRRANPAKTLATWMLVGAAASVTLGLVGSKLLESDSAPRAAAPLLTAPTSRAAAPSSPDISPEPAVPPAPTIDSARPHPASSDEVRQIEAARAAINRGDPNAAIAHLNDYDAAHPNGQLKSESMALRIQALTAHATEAYKP